MSPKIIFVRIFNKGFTLFVKRKWIKKTLASINPKELCIQAIKSMHGTKPAVNVCYGSLKSIFITVKMIRISSDHAVLLRM